MRHFAFSILFVFTYVIVNGQVFSSVDILAGANNTYRSIDGEGGGTEEIRNDTEIRKENFHVGFNFNKRFANKFHFKTGLRYLSLGYRTKERTLTFADMSTSKLYFTYDYHFIEVPLNVRMEFTEKKKLIPYVELGLAAMFLFEDKKVLYQDNKDATSTRTPTGDGFNKFHVALNVNAGIIYALSGGGTMLFLQAQYRYDFTNLVKSDTFKENLLGYGVEVGVRRALSYEFVDL